MAKQKKPVRPLLERCPQCLAAAGVKCTDQGFVLESVHMARYAIASIRQTPPQRTPNANILMVKCPRCGAMPRRTCAGPPPMRDPKPYHKERWLEKFKLDNAQRKALGMPVLELEEFGRPWLENRDAPAPRVLGWRDKRAIADEKEARDQSD